MTPTVYHRPAQAPGFTLVEILVCIAVIGVLMIISVPVVSRMRQSTSQVQCINRLRECGQGVLVQANDYQGNIESTIGGTSATISNGFWNMLLFQRGYITDKRVFRCPTGKASFPLDSITTWMWSTYGLNMQTNSFAEVDGSDFRLYIRRVERLSEYPLLMDSATATLQQSFRIAISGDGFACRHFKKANTFFLDGHITSVDSDTAKGVYNLKAFVE